jgi:hypothetical protein
MTAAYAVGRQLEERVTLTHRVRDRFEVIDPVTSLPGDDVAADDLPPTRSGESRGMLAAQVVAVRLMHRG